MRVSFYSILAVVFLLFFISSCDDSTNNATDNDNVSSGETKFLTAGNSSSQDYNNGTPEDGADEDIAAGEDDEHKDAEREIAESDIYYVSGDTLWLVNAYKGLISVDISNPSALKIVGRASFKGTPGEMYMKDNKAFILVSGVSENDGITDGYYYNRYVSKLIVVDTADPAKPSVESTYEIKGYFVDSRMVGDVIYVVATEYKYYWYTCDNYETQGDDKINIMSINVADPANIEKSDETSVPGTTYTIYVSNKSIYVTENNNSYSEEGGYSSDVTLFDISNVKGKISKRGTLKTKGYVSDRWKMHESGNKFFAITSSGWNEDNLIESFDITDKDHITKTGELVFMQNQQLYGTKFDNNKMYAVTYYRQDPLHVIDITDPANMTELGQLAVPGWSNYLEVQNDRIFAVGVDDTDGFKAKLSMYNVADPTNPVEMGSISFGTGYSSSTASYDWKAFKIISDLNLILLPVNSYSYDYYHYTYNLHLIDYDMNTGLKERGHISSNSSFLRGIALTNKLMIGITSSEVITADIENRDEPSELGKITLAYYAGELDTCGKNLCGVDSNYYSANTVLAAYDPDNETAPIKWKSDTLPETYGYYRFMKAGDKGYLGGFDYYYDYGMVDDAEGVSTKASSDERTNSVSVFDLNSGDFPKLLGNVKIKIPENDGYYSYYYQSSSAVTESGAFANVSRSYDVYYPEAECYGSDENCDTSGKSEYISFSNINVYNLSDPSVETAEPVMSIKADASFDYTSEIFANGSSLWYTTCEEHGKDSDNRPMLACYAESIDTTDPKAPVKDKKVNIPGNVAGISDDGNYLYTVQREWKRISSGSDDGYYDTYSRKLFILKFNSDRTDVSVIKEIELEDSYSYSYYNSESYGYTYTNYIIQNDRVLIGKNTIDYGSDSCNYYRERSIETDVQVYKAEDGKTVLDKTFKDGSSFYAVKGGGFLIMKYNYNSYYYYGYASDRNITYISPEGKTAEFSLTDNGYGYYYYNINSVLKDGTLYIAKDWYGIEKVELSLD